MMGVCRYLQIREAVTAVQLTAIIHVLTRAYKVYAGRYHLKVSEATNLFHMDLTGELPK